MDPMTTLGIETAALRWVEEERAYSTVKWPPEKSDEVTRLPQRLTPGGPLPWAFWIRQYLDRAITLGLDTPNGMQAVGKMATTAIAMLDSVHRLYGPLPAPGHPSGEIEEWSP